MCKGPERGSARLVGWVVGDEAAEMRRGPSMQCLESQSDGKALKGFEWRRLNFPGFETTHGHKNGALGRLRAGRVSDTMVVPGRMKQAGS